jgi:hypothetical protein
LFGGVFATLLAAAFGCGSTGCGTVTPSAPPGPANSCPKNPCQAYAGGPYVQCVQGTCVAGVDPLNEGGTSFTSDIVLVISTASDAFYAPGRTFVVSFDVLREEPYPGRLPAVVSESGLYSVLPSVASNDVHWNLGATANDVSLPIQASFQPILLLNPDGTTSVDVTSLPLAPIVATVQEGNDPYGPGGRPSTSYVARDLPKGVYQRTVTPDAPFDQAFGPLIDQIQVVAGGFQGERVTGYEPVNSVLPTATITRERGTFDGWTAYLRDLNNQAVLSNVAPLSGQSTTVTFAVLRVNPPLPDGGLNDDAYQSAELVVAPPAGSVEPTYIGTITHDFLAPPRYPTLPPPVLVEGSILANGEPVAADLVFEATAITTVVNGVPQPDKSSFELTRWVVVGAGDGHYSVVLPPGQYRFDIRPHDAHALLVRDLEVPVQYDPLRVDVSLGTLTSAYGAVAVADGRSLENVVVEALPVQCAQPAVLAQEKSSQWCLPRPTRTTTAEDGGFVLELDPGQYTLRAEPTADSRLPWVSTGHLDVTTTTASDAGTVVLPAPLSLGMVLQDLAGNAVPSALVRAFRTSSQGDSVELGVAVTDATGRYELYVAPPP